MLVDLACLFCLAFFIVQGWRRGFRASLVSLLINFSSTVIALVLNRDVSHVIQAWLIEHGISGKAAAVSDQILTWFSAGEGGPIGASLEFFSAIFQIKGGDPAKLLNMINGDIQYRNMALDRLGELLISLVAQVLAFLITYHLAKVILGLFIRLISRLLDKVQGVELVNRLGGCLLGLVNYLFFLIGSAYCLNALLIFGPSLISYFDDSFIMTLIWQGRFLTKILDIFLLAS